MSNIELASKVMLVVDGDETELGSVSVVLSGLDVTNKLSRDFLEELLDKIQDLMGMPLGEDNAKTS